MNKKILLISIPTDKTIYSAQVLKAVTVRFKDEKVLCGIREKVLLPKSLRLNAVLFSKSFINVIKNFDKPFLF